MKKYDIIVLSLSFLWACSGDPQQVTKPDGLIEQEKLIELLVDVHLADAVLAEKRHHDTDIAAKNSSYYNSVFVKHGVSREQMTQSLDYYTYDPKLLEDIYEEVNKRLEAMKEKYKDAKLKKKTS